MHQQHSNKAHSLTPHTWKSLIFLWSASESEGERAGSREVRGESGDTHPKSLDLYSLYLSLSPPVATRATPKVKVKIQNQ